MQDAVRPGHIAPTVPRHFIGGSWVEPNSAAVIDVEDPSTCEIVGAVAAGDAADIDRAVAAAADAMATARRTKWGPSARQDALLALAAAIEADAEEFARLESLDSGKPIANSRNVDVPVAAAALRYYAGWATKLTGETMELSSPGHASACTRVEPVGVVGQIVPWNYPLVGAANKLGPAIAAGCAVVLKPAEQTSLSTLRLAVLTARCGFPPGFVNVVTGRGEEVGAALVEHPDVAKIAFTGSTAVGVKIAESCGRQMKRCTVELGGKSAVIVMPDADLDAAARGIASSIFFNTGQSCSAGSRLFVHNKVRDELVERIAEIARTFRVGPALDPETRLGPVISEAQRSRVSGYVNDAVRRGARPLVAGTLPQGAGYFVAPTILTDVPVNAPALEEEIFGPVLCAIGFETEDLDEIAGWANDSRYGLAAYVWTSNIAVARGLVDRLQAGTVRVNSGGGTDLALPAGGVKMSGFGRENGRVGVMAYTELKSVVVAY